MSTGRMVYQIKTRVLIHNIRTKKTGEVRHNLNPEMFFPYQNM